MKISGVKLQASFDLGEIDIDLKDVVELVRLDHEHSRELRRECRECENERRIAKPSSETKEFVEAVVNKAIAKIKEEIKDSLKSKILPKRGRQDEPDPDDRIED